MKRTVLYGVAAMAAVVVMSNIMVQFLLGNWLTWGAFVYPLAFLVTDLINRAHGVAAARKVVAVGFAVGIGCSLLGSFIDGPSGPLVTLRIAIGSGTAFLAAQLLDVAIFDRLREGTWWRAPLVSSVIGSTIDTILFFAIAFSSQLAFLELSNDVSWANELVPFLGFGPASPLWVSLATADFGVKMAVAIVALGPFRFLSLRMLEKRETLA